MSSVAYPSYSDSKIQWIGKIPNHWKVLPLYAMAIERDQSNKGMLEDNLLSLSYGRIIRKDMSSNDGLLPESFETYQIVCPGDIVFRLTDLQNDKRSLRSALVEERGIITSAYVAIAPQGTDSRYLSFLFRAYDVTKVFYSMGGGLRQAMKYDDLKRLPVVMPPLAEQVSIAHFLDQETSKIDALISEQRRLIELLKEKRQAVISHAVTKGLNPGVRMKPSGVEWLGEVPEHWSLIPLKHCVKLLADKAEDTVFPIALENVQSWTGNFVESEGDFSGEGVAFQAGDVLFGKLRPYLAKAFLADRAGEAVGDFHVLRPRKSVFGRWLQYRILSREFIAEINSASFGSKMPRVSWEFMGKMPIPLPPMAEQQAVAHKLNTELAVIDELVVDADKSIALLQERRTSLISAAVTGKIDVRNYATTQKDAA